MAAPTVLTDADIAFDGTDPKTSGSLTLQTGDILVTVGVGADGADSLAVSSTPSLTWTEQQQVNVASFTRVYGWTATSGSNAGHTVTIDRTAGADFFGGCFIPFRNSDGIGASAKINDNAGGTDAQINLTTTQDNSAVVVVIGDWASIDGATRAWLAVNGITPTAGNGHEKMYARDAAQGAMYVAVYPDVGTAGAKTLGITDPNGLTRSLVAIEVKGSAGGGVAGQGPPYEFNWV